MLDQGFFNGYKDISLILDITGQLRKFQKFILNVNNGKQEEIQIMYGIHWEKELKEIILPQLKGYKDSLPVRVGNAAFSQKQNDIYGVLMDSIYTSLIKFPTTLDTSEELWTFVEDLWYWYQRPGEIADKSIWEIRGSDYHFVLFKGNVMGCN